MNPLKDKSNKISQPATKSGHFVQFYKDDNELVDNLAAYVAEGLKKGEGCIIIAEKAHRQLMNAKLEKNSSGLAARLEGRYIEVDVQEILNAIMKDGMPDAELFFMHMNDLIKQAGKHSKSVRFYGEMVAVLWKQGNKAAVIQLEELRNKFIKGKSVQLYCAYPSLHFCMDSEIRREIEDLHHI